MDEKIIQEFEVDEDIEDEELGDITGFEPVQLHHTLITTEKGTIEVIHQITLGDLITSTILMATLIFMVLERVIRR